MVALLRGINVGGNKMVPMARLRELAESLKLEQVQTYIQSGNLLFVSSYSPDEVEALLERAIHKTFGFEVPVIVRTHTEWQVYTVGSAFKHSETERPALLHLGLSKRPPAQGAQGLLDARCAQGERALVTNNGVWLDYSASVARSKLSPAFLDKAIGSVVTARNWKTVCAIADLFEAFAT